MHHLVPAPFASLPLMTTMKGRDQNLGPGAHHGDVVNIGYINRKTGGCRLTRTNRPDLYLESALAPNLHDFHLPAANGS